VIVLSLSQHRLSRITYSDFRIMPYALAGRCGNLLS